MKYRYIKLGYLFAIVSLASAICAATETSHSVAQPNEGPACTGFGPQTPRDIDNKEGVNPQSFSMAPKYEEMNLCNIHFHNNAEHKAKEFSIAAVADEHGHGGGYQCTMSKKLSKAELDPVRKEICKGLKPGDTIEVHWVHSSCQVTPGSTLAACLNDKCTNPGLRVEAQIFTLVNDPTALNFKNLSYNGHSLHGHPQATAIPNYTGKPVEFLGSTTGPKYNDTVCSPMQVTWSVRPQCAKLDINSLGEWCEKNEFAEDHAHGVRKLVADRNLLSKIK